jgi:hypothetical protein
MGIMNQPDDIEEVQVGQSVTVNKSQIFKPEFKGGNYIGDNNNLRESM